MRRPKSLLRLAGISLGTLGIAVCIASLVILWMASSRLARATDNLFSKMDKSLAVVRQRAIQTQERVAAAEANAEELGATLRDWTKQEAARRLTLELNVAEKSERLMAALQQADNSLEVAESSVGLVQDMLSINASTSAPSDSTLVDRLMEELASLRAQLAEATGFVARVQDRLADANNETPTEERFGQAAPLALRVVAALASLEPRLTNFTDNISAAQSKVQNLKAKTQSWILVITIGITLLILLMAAGQIALCRLAWTGGEKSKSR